MSLDKRIKFGQVCCVQARCARNEYRQHNEGYFWFLVSERDSLVQVAHSTTAFVVEAHTTPGNRTQPVVRPRWGFYCLSSLTRTPKFADYGVARAAMSYNVRDVGEEVTVRACHSYFIPLEQR